ncbi:hypothetical protein HanRHA438_Chr04g0152701 [Helianthus annuus]|nr:hypothetical protein HanRHA438_Chr04g0152701 [Helianthus annuus]
MNSGPIAQAKAPTASIVFSRTNALPCSNTRRSCIVIRSASFTRKRIVSSVLLTFSKISLENLRYVFEQRRSHNSEQWLAHVCLDPPSWRLTDTVDQDIRHLRLQDTTRMRVWQPDDIADQYSRYFRAQKA